ncbi:MAG: radical SAM protein, partial [Candidatus Korarchaeota archaeon]
MKTCPLSRREQASYARCVVCERRCLIREKERGICGARVNIKGQLYSLNYGNLSAIESRPIEIKPFYHFWPGTSAITISSLGCNFHCPWCQNWNLSMAMPSDTAREIISVERVVNLALSRGDCGTCVSFNEPAMMFEYMIELFPFAKKHNLYNTIVTNGYFTLDALDMLIDVLDGARIDIKGGTITYQKWLNANDEIVWRNARYLKEKGVHVEMIYLVVTGVNDEDYVEIIEKHRRYLGVDVPLHINRYFPAYRHNAPATPLSLIDKIYSFARESGINYVYVGNVPADLRRNTYCPS